MFDLKVMSVMLKLEILTWALLILADLLDNRRILLLAKKVGTDWEPLGKALGVPDEELNEIKEDPDGTTYQGAFKMLWAWRQTQPSHDEAASTDTLRRALQQVNKGQLFDQLAAN
jgi:hypothetical protein